MGSLAVTLLLALSAAFTGDDAKRPYEMVWANRTRDDHAPLVALTDAAGWTVQATDAAATFVRATDRLLFGDGVCRLTYRATGANPRVFLQPPKPVPVKGAFDTVSCWIYGNNHSYAPDPATPPVTVTAEFHDAQGSPFSVRLQRVAYKEWFLAWHRLTDEQIARVRNGGTFVGFTVTGGLNREDRSIDFNSFCAFVDDMKPLTFRPRAKRPNRVFPGAPAGLNTGAGELPFPNTPLGVVPKTKPDARLEVRVPSDPANWDGLAVRWKGGEWQRVAVGGGIWHADGKSLVRRAVDRVSVVTNRVAPLDVTVRGGGITTRFHMEGKSLVADVASDDPNVAEVRFGFWGNLSRGRFVPVPYYTYHNWSAVSRPGVLAAELPERPLFHAAILDWTQSNASRVRSVNVRWDGTQASNGGAEYLKRGDGRRNACRERLVYAFSDRFEEVLPNVPNPPSPWKHVTGKGVWCAHGAGDRAKDAEYWRHVRSRGLRHVIVTDHETGWRDGNESFTFRTEPAPGKGGDRGQHDYARTMIDELGFVYGPYNNFTDFAPVNGRWDVNHVARDPDLQLATAWDRCYAPKPAYAVESCEELPPIIQRKFNFTTAYCDVHTAMAPWDRTDYDARVPGGGTFAATFYAYGEIMLIQKRCWRGPVYSEGGMHYLYCGLADGNYAQDQSYRIAENPWLVDFDLLRLHPLCCNFGMGAPYMFYPDNSAPADREVATDRFLAATVAFGHPGFLLGDGVSHQDRSYFMVQALAADYTQSEVEAIRYLDADGKAHDTSDAVLTGALARSQVVVRYANGTVVAANGSPIEAMKLPGGLWLPPNGYCGWTSDRKVFVYSGLVDGHRVDYAVSPEYVFMDGRGVETALPGGTCKGSVIRLREKDTGAWPTPAPSDFASRSRTPEGMRSSEQSGVKISLSLPYGRGMRRRGKDADEEVVLETGAYVNMQTVVCGGVAKQGYGMHPPYQGGCGLVYAVLPLVLPFHPVTFTACVGKGDGSSKGDGILYRLELDDGTGSRRVLATRRVTDWAWAPIEADLSPWKGKGVRLFLVADCGEANDTAGDWSGWADLCLRPR